jgi:hypothetical protein
LLKDKPLMTNTGFDEKTHVTISYGSHPNIEISFDMTDSRKKKVTVNHQNAELNQTVNKLGLSSGFLPIERQ